MRRLLGKVASGSEQCLGDELCALFCSYFSLYCLTPYYFTALLTVVFSFIVHQWPRLYFTCCVHGSRDGGGTCFVGDVLSASGYGPSGVCQTFIFFVELILVVFFQVTVPAMSGAGFRVLRMYPFRHEKSTCTCFLASLCTDVKFVRMSGWITAGSSRLTPRSIFVLRMP